MRVCGSYDDFVVLCSGMDIQANTRVCFLMVAWLKFFETISCCVAHYLDTLCAQCTSLSAAWVFLTSCASSPKSSVLLSSTRKKLFQFGKIFTFGATWRRAPEALFSWVPVVRLSG